MRSSAGSRAAASSGNYVNVFTAGSRREGARTRRFGSFIDAGNGEWGGKMQQDLLGGMDWAVREGIADKDKVAIFGASYGGYAALMGATMTPERFACGVDLTAAPISYRYSSTRPLSRRASKALAAIPERWKGENSSLPARQSISSTG